MMLTGCHTSRNAADRDDIYARENSRRGRKLPKTVSAAAHDESGAATPSANAVIEAARAWLGVPYLYGGNTRDGVDCSGLTCMAYREGAGIVLPRTSREQAQRGTMVAKELMRPGDLVFFTSKTGGDRINHVAIYIGAGQIIHATVSKGVYVSRLDDDYWHTHYHCCRRVL